MSDNFTDKEKLSILTQKLSAIGELIRIVKEYNIEIIKTMCKDNTQPQLKLLNIKTEILKIDDKLDDITNLIHVSDSNKSKDTIAKIYNMINEEISAYMMMEDKSNNEVIVSNNLDYNNETETEEQSIKREFYEKSEKYRMKKNYDKNPEFHDQLIQDAIQEQQEWLKQQEWMEEQSSGEQQFWEEVYADAEKEYKEKQIDDLMQAKKEFEDFVGVSGIKPDDEDFNEYYELRQSDRLKLKSCDYKNGKIRIYSKYDLNGFVKDNPWQLENLSKRKLPTEVFRYLILNNILKEGDFVQFSTNQFGRTFESKMGDIIRENELPQAENRQKRYNKLDFTKYNKTSFNGVIYVSNQWDENSISKFIDYITEHYGEYVKIENPGKDFIDSIQERKNSSVASKYNSRTDAYDYEINK